MKKVLSAALLLALRAWSAEPSFEMPAAGSAGSSAQDPAMFGAEITIDHIPLAAVKHVLSDGKKPGMYAVYSISAENVSENEIRLYGGDLLRAARATGTGVVPWRWATELFKSYKKSKIHWIYDGALHVSDAAAIAVPSLQAAKKIKSSGYLSVGLLVGNFIAQYAHGKQEHASKVELPTSEEWLTAQAEVTLRPGETRAFVYVGKWIPAIRDKPPVYQFFPVNRAIVKAN